MTQELDKGKLLGCCQVLVTLTLLIFSSQLVQDFLVIGEVWESEQVETGDGVTWGLCGAESSSCPAVYVHSAVCHIQHYTLQLDLSDFLPSLLHLHFVWVALLSIVDVMLPSERDHLLRLYYIVVMLPVHSVLHWGSTEMVTRTGLDSFPPQSTATTEITWLRDSAEESSSLLVITPVSLICNQATL